MICQRQSKSVYLTTPDAHQPGLHNDRSSSRRKKLPPDVCRSCGHPVRLSRARAARSRACADSLPENRLHGVIAGKLYPYARFRRWPHGIEITQIIRNASMTDTPVSAAVGLIRSGSASTTPSARPSPPNSPPPGWTATASCTGLSCR